MPHLVLIKLILDVRYLLLGDYVHVGLEAHNRHRGKKKARAHCYSGKPLEARCPAGFSFDPFVFLKCCSHRVPQLFQ